MLQRLMPGLSAAMRAARCVASSQACSCVRLKSSTILVPGSAPPEAYVMYTIGSSQDAKSAGASGAAVVDTSGSILGLVTSNTRHSSAGSFPHWSFALAAAQLQPIVACLHQPGSSSRLEAALQQLDLPDEELTRLWRVGNLSMPLMQDEPEAESNQQRSSAAFKAHGAQRLAQLVGPDKLGQSTGLAGLSRL